MFLTRLFLVTISCIFILPCTTTCAQGFRPSVFDNALAALWVASPDVPGDAFGVYHFRKSFTLDALPERFTVHVSGDNRYRLMVNGELVSTGPQRSDLLHWRYETVDFSV